MDRLGAIVRYAHGVPHETRPTLEGLPTEVLDQIFAFLVAANSPKDCASLAKTCRHINACWITIRDRANCLYELRFENPILSPGRAFGMPIPTLQEVHWPLIQELCANPNALALARTPQSYEALEAELTTSLSTLKAHRKQLDTLRRRPRTAELAETVVFTTLMCWSGLGTLVAFAVAVGYLCKQGVTWLRMNLLIKKIQGIALLIFSIPLAAIGTVLVPFVLISLYIYVRIRSSNRFRQNALQIPPLEARAKELEIKCVILLNTLGRELNAELAKMQTKEDDITPEHPLRSKTAKIKQLFKDFLGPGATQVTLRVRQNTPLRNLFMLQGPEELPQL